MNKLEVELRPIDSLIPYARNSRTHSEAQITAIAASLQEFGWTNPVLVDGENGIIAGHGRVMAARKLGQTEVPCIELSHLTKAQKRAYVIADNKLSEKAGWDQEMLKLEIEDLQLENFNLDLTGFEMKELQGLLADPEELMDPREKQDSKLDAMGKLTWEKKIVPITQDEIEILDRMYDQYIKDNGVTYGFVRQTFGAIRS